MRRRDLKVQFRHATSRWIDRGGSAEGRSRRHPGLLKPKHHPTEEYTEYQRAKLHDAVPDCSIYFEAANITNQILNFGLPAPIDLQISGRDATKNYQVAQEVEKKIAALPGAADVHIHQVVDYPEVRVNEDRSKADQLVLTERDVTNAC